VYAAANMSKDDGSTVQLVSCCVCPCIYVASVDPAHRRGQTSILYLCEEQVEVVETDLDGITETMPIQIVQMMVIIGNRTLGRPADQWIRAHLLLQLRKLKRMT
jgi:hypothetical protein